MPEDRRLTITSSLQLHPDEVARRTFSNARRGFDAVEVRAYLDQVARELAAASEREQELRVLLAEAERRAENPVLDEATLATALGQETARVLRAAHEAAADIQGRAEADANRMVTEAQEEAGKIQALAEQHAVDRASQSEATAAETRRRAQEEAAARVEAAHAESEALLEHARAECRAMLTEAQELRARVLGDLTRRRRVLHSQIEQLRAGRDRLAETIGGVRDAVDRATDDLFRAEDEARIAAEAAGRQLARADHGELASRQAEVALGAGPDVRGLQPGSEVREIPVAEPAGVAEPGEAAEPAAATEAAASVETAPRHPGTGEPALEPVEDPARSQSVDELFARLRAERGPEPPEPPASPGLSGSAGPSGAVEAQPEGANGAREVVPAGAGTAHASRRRHSKAEEQTAPPELSAEPEATEVVGPAEAPAEAPAESEEPERHDLLTRRDEVLLPVVATLARRLKRALSDDQNDILDRLRAAKGWGPDLLVPETEHIEMYASAGREQLFEAARSGAIFAGGKADDTPGIEDIASDLASAIVVPLRRRLEDDGAKVDTGDEAALVEQVGAAFRDWKGARVERLAGDEAVAAFSRSALAATAARTSLTWVVDDEGVECPDCDDNALAGPVPRGEAFPTGHPHPPAHAGCRCLLAPVDA
ncbi:MAG TPA: DivIVA domain-containing protein [Acidimicrobiales bacterium]|nr:DivIVA domain-containing protein [Acidimicrobiales bacterium]